MKKALSHNDMTEMTSQSSAYDLPKAGQYWSTGITAIDSCLPQTGLSRVGLHEIEPFRPSDMPSLNGFTFALLSRLRSHQPIIWCVTAQQIGDYGQPYAFGLERYGISPAQIIFVKVRRPVDLHFAVEEALKTDNVAAVIAEGPRPSFTGSRRISLLCRAYQRPCLLMSSHQQSTSGSAALSRWQVKPEPSIEDPRDPYGPGLPTWRVALPRIRNGTTMPPMSTGPSPNHPDTSYPWRICWYDQTYSFCPATLFSNRALYQSEPANRASAKTLLGHAG